MPESGTSNLEFGYENLGSTREQMAAAGILHYFNVVETFNRLGKQHAEWVRKSGKSGEDSTNVAVRASFALEDLYFSSDKQELLDSWGSEGEVYDTYLRRVTPGLDESKNRLASESFNAFRRVQIAYSAGKKLAGNLRPEQKQRLLNTAGYSGQEIGDIVKNIGLSTAITTAVSFASLPILGAVTAEGLAHPTLSNIQDRNTQIALALSYIAHYSSLFLVTKENLRLLKNDNLHSSANMFATSIYYLLEKLVPGHEKIRDITTIVVPMIPFILQEPALVSALSLDAGTTAVFSRNVVYTGLNVALAGLSEIWLRKKS